MNFIFKFFEKSFGREVGHHLVKLDDYFGDNVGIVRQGRMASPFDGPSEAGEQIV